MTNDKVQLTTRIPKQTRIDVNIIAKRKGTTVAAIVIDLLNEYIEKNKELL